QNTVYAAKRLIGRKYSSAQVQEAMKVLPYVVVEGQHDDLRIRMGDRDLSLPEISAMILAELKLDAEAYFGRTVTQAVITVPAYFNDGQRQATKDAGAIAGLEVLRILNEPTAAALAYGFGKKLNGKIAVFDLGGGTFDVSVLEVKDGVYDVIATGGDTYLGGEDFDHRVMEWLVSDFAQEHGVDLRKDRMALQRLKDAAEKAKIELSSTQEAQLHLPFISTPPGGKTAFHLQKTLTREQLEALTADLCDRTVKTCERVLGDAKVRPAELKEVILVGGMTRMPRIVEVVKAFFGRDPCKGVHPDEVVALGAAVQAQSVTAGGEGQQTQALLLDVTPQSLGVAVAGGYVRTLIPKNTTVPTAVTETFNTSRDAQTVVKIMVLQGESEIAHQNELLGEFILTGLRQAKRGEVEIGVTFEINAEGIVSVSATDKDTGVRQSIAVTASGGLTPDELREIIDEQRDYLLEAKSAEQTQRKAGELREVLRELSALMPNVQALSTGSDFGHEALRKVQQALAAGKKALDSPQPSVLAGAQEQVSRTLTLIKAFLQRSAGA
ncbi:MAG TPA: Hsp70 family protein, partial [Myxococcaceae bacterium]|nr:Hsp70 family protein [Myxococcaceae bacterium]